jgi:hypothetical protein
MVRFRTFIKQWRDTLLNTHGGDSTKIVQAVEQILHSKIIRKALLGIIPLFNFFSPCVYK